MNLKNNMPQRIDKRQQRGMTLIELLVAMTISLILFFAIGVVYMTTRTGFTFANNSAQMSEDSAMAIDFISRDIRMAAYGGCAGTSLERIAPGPDGVLYTADDVFDNPVISTLRTTNPKLANVNALTLTALQQPNPFSNTVLSAQTAIQGFPGGSSTAAAAARTALGSSTAYSINTTSPILFVSGASQQAMQLSSASLTTDDRINVGPTDPYNWANNTGSTFFLVSDCNRSEIFRATSMPITTSIYGLVTENTSSTHFVNGYSAGATISPLISSTYFLATPTGATTTSLYRRNFNGFTATFEELVKNVEAISFHYGENTTINPATATPGYVPDIYRTNATAVTDWSRVVSVRIGLIMVSEDTNVTAGADPTINWIDNTYTPLSTTDGRLRRAYTTTVSIRNRMGV
jgi:type IV pilus assembly protein PilW